MADVNTFALNESPGLFLGKDTNPGGGHKLWDEPD